MKKIILNILLKIKKIILLNIFISTLIIILNIFIPIFIGIYLYKYIYLMKIDYFIIKIFILSILIRFISFFNILLKFINNILNHYISLYIIKKIRIILFKKILIYKNTYKLFNNKNKIFTLIILNIEKVENLYIKIILPIFKILLMLFLILITIIYLYKMLLINFLIFLILIISLFYFFIKYLFKINKIHNINEKKFILYIIKSLNNIYEYLIFNNKYLFIKNINRNYSNIYKIYIIKEFIKIYYNFILYIIIDIIIINSIYFYFKKNYFIIIPFIIIFNDLYKYIKELIDNLINLEYLYNLNFLNNKKTKIKDFIYKIKKNLNYNEIIEIYNLTYLYNKKIILKNIFLKINKYSKNLILGNNGSGKSTLFNILTKLTTYHYGNIFIKNILLEKWDEKYFRRYLKCSTQETYILDKNFLNNIGLNKYINNKFLNNFLKKFELNDVYEKYKFLNNLKTYENNISFGEKRIINTLRSVISNFEILILDEPTIGLNKKLEKDIFKFIFKKTFKKTLIIFSNFLIYPKIWDNIYILKNNNFIEYGNHKELILFKKEYLLYYKYFIKNKKS